MCESLAVNATVRLNEFDVEICVQGVVDVKVDRDKVINECIDRDENVNVCEDLWHIQTGQAS